MVICKEQCDGNMSILSSSATLQMTLFHLTEGGAKMKECCTDGPSRTNVLRRPIFLHSVILAPSRHYP